MSRRISSFLLALLLLLAAVPAWAQVGELPQGLARLNRVVSRYVRDGSPRDVLVQDMTHDPVWQDPQVRAYVVGMYSYGTPLDTYPADALHPTMRALLAEMQSWEPRQLNWYIGDIQPGASRLVDICAGVKQTSPLQRMGASLDDANLSSAQRILADTIANDAFLTSRRLAHYGTILGPAFQPRLDALTAGQHWLDAGAGEARAIHDYLQGGGVARTTAVAAVQSKASVVPLLQDAYPSRFTFIQSMINDVAVGDIPPVDLLTDMYGPLTYTETPADVLAHYARLLAPGGDVMTLVEIDTEIVDAAGNDVPLERFVREWIESSTGFDLVDVTPYYYDNGAERGVRIHLRRNAEDVDIAPVPLIDLIPARPPQRTFRWVPSRPGSRPPAPVFSGTPGASTTLQ